MVFQMTKNTYLGSANPCENIDSISIPLKIQNIIKNIQSPMLKEYLKDLARDSKQRIDIFQKNPQIFKNEEHIQTIHKISFRLLPNAPKSGSITFQTPIGNIKAPKEIISPVLENLTKKEMRFDELLDLPSFKDNPIFLIETIFLLMNANFLYPVSMNAKSLDKIAIEKFNEKMKQDGIKLRISSDGGIIV
ncbi:methyltransferase regulatory domain-containing protein, partial [Acinetobacter puyangensis]|uniref:methyltransferase regulatory domain-containing protein n=1 Tax=Acinetobacter puyangensis TaxID=1096779 RepID=UPI003A4DC433